MKIQRCRLGINLPKSGNFLITVDILHEAFYPFRIDGGRLIPDIIRQHLNITVHPVLQNIVRDIHRISAPDINILFTLAHGLQLEIRIVVKTNPSHKLGYRRL